MDILSSIRAFVGGESLWSKAQRDVAYYLNNYAVSHNEADYLVFKTAILVPQGDRRAREELEKTKPNYSAIYEGFIQGGIHPDDIPGMIRLFRRFRDIAEVHQAILLWEEGDGYIETLNQAGEELHRRIISGETGDEMISPILTQIHQSNDQLIVAEKSFAETLGNTSRKVHLLLLIAMLITAVSLALLSVCLSRRMLKRNEAFEQALRISEERFRLAMTGSNDGLWDWDLLTNEIYRSPRFKQLLGYADEEISNESGALTHLLHPEDRDLTLSAIDAHLTHDIPYDFECRLATKAGEYRWFRLRGEAIRDNEGKPVRVAGAINDITERKQSEEHIRQLNADLEGRVVARTAALESAMNELEAFSYSISHDLRAPLRHITLYSTMLQNNCAALLPDTGKQQLNSIARSTKRMNDLIRDLLEFSRMGKTELRHRQINMNTLVSEIIQEIQESTSERTIEWQIDTLPEVRADYGMLRQVWANLLFNAVKYTSRCERAVIHVGYREHISNEWEFFVQDNGAGFDMQYANKLFQVFQRLHRMEEYEGTGIGLANVRRIITRHRGRTWAEGKVNEGATFYFTLPL